MSADRPIRLAHVLTSVRDGGLEKIVFELCKGLPKDRFRPEVCALMPDNPWADMLQAEGVPFHSFEARNRGGFSTIGTNTWVTLQLARHFRRSKPDIVIVHDFFPGVLGRVASHLGGVPHRVATLHATYDWLDWKAGLVNRFLGLGTRAVVCVSQAAKEASLPRDRLPESRYIVVPNGIDTTRFRPDPEGGRVLRRRLGWADSEFVVGSVGVLRETKRQIDLVRAMAVVMAADPSYRLVLVGTPRNQEKAYERELRAALAELPEGKWNLIQDLRDLGAYYNAFDMVVLPSESEGFGLVLAEAMASGSPCLAADIPAHREVAGDAALYHAPRQVGAIAAGIGRLHADSGLRAALGGRARETVLSKYSLDHMIEGWRRILEGLGGRQ